MGGRIWATNRPTGGAEFGFTLRVLEGDEEFARDEADEPRHPALPEDRDGHEVPVGPEASGVSPRA
jgi:hypothetical protein